MPRFFYAGNMLLKGKLSVTQIYAIIFSLLCCTLCVTSSAATLRQLPEYQQPPAQLNFAINSATLENYLYGAVGRIADALEQQPQLQVILVGYTDLSDHSDSRSLLAQRRAVHVADVLVHDFGIDEGRIRVRSVDASHLVEPIKLQRRVEVLFTQARTVQPTPPE